MCVVYEGLFILKWSRSGKGLEMTCLFFLNSFLVEAATDGHRTNHRADEGSEPTADASLLLLWCLNWTTTQTPAVSRSASPGGLQC